MKKFSVILALCLVLMAGSAWATFINPVSWDGAGNDLQSRLNAIAAGGNIGVDAQGADNDALPFDEVWATGGAGSGSTFLIEITGHAGINTFGIYDPANSANNVQIFAGSAQPGAFPGANAQILILADGSVLKNNVDTGVNFSSNNVGYYIGNETAGDWTDVPLFFSQSFRNPSGSDQMVAFGPGNGVVLNIPGLNPSNWLANEYILAFEDLFGTLSNTSGAGLSDYDFNDMVILIESVTPVPEPATMLLLGSGLIGLAGIGRRKFFKK